METIKVLQNMEERFDYALYSKARGNENRLSDIVWAMCKSDKEFFKTFFEFCFPKENKNIELHGIDREVDHDENGRNDFNIYTNKGLYIVESKIGDTNINTQKYLPIVEYDSERITYIVPGNWNGNMQQLEAEKINVVYWEEFIETIKENFTFFTRKAELILNIQDKYLPPIEFVEKEIKIIEDFKSQFMSKNEHFETQTETWTDKNNPYYGYYCWASVWFGIGYNPLKGVFFCFTIGKGGKKVIGGDKTPKKLKELGPFQKSIKLGKRKDNNYYNYYFEVAVDDINNMTVDILDEAFREFADKIIVIEGTKEIPLLEYINYGRSK